MLPLCTLSVSSRRLSAKLIGVHPRQRGRATPCTTSAPHERGWAGHAYVEFCHWPAPAGRRDPVRQRPGSVVIRRRLEDTVKMAAVSGLVRRPLEQVGSGTQNPCETLAHPSSSLSALFLFLPGLRAAEEALPPDSVRGAAGDWLGH